MSWIINELLPLVSRLWLLRRHNRCRLRLIKRQRLRFTFRLGFSSRLVDRSGDAFFFGERQCIERVEFQFASTEPTSRDRRSF